MEVGRRHVIEREGVGYPTVGFFLTFRSAFPRHASSRAICCDQQGLNLPVWEMINWQTLYLRIWCALVRQHAKWSLSFI
jgi:hypothetical protein